MTRQLRATACEQLLHTPCVGCSAPAARSAKKMRPAQVPQTGLPAVAKLRSSGIRPQRSAIFAMVVLSPALARMLISRDLYCKLGSISLRYLLAALTARNYQSINTRELLLGAHFHSMHARQLAQTSQVLAECSLQRKYANTHRTPIGRHRVGCCSSASLHSFKTLRVGYARAK